MKLCLIERQNVLISSNRMSKIRISKRIASGDTNYASDRPSRAFAAYLQLTLLL